MEYIPQDYKVSEQELDDILPNVEDAEIRWTHLLMIDYVYHHQNPNYEGGLSFIDRLVRKLGRFHPNWDIQDLKNEIRYSYDPQYTYIQVIARMLSNPGHVAYYGV